MKQINSKSIIYKLDMAVNYYRGKKYERIREEELFMIDLGEEEEWKHGILPRFETMMMSANSIGYYANHDWFVRIWRCEILDNGIILPQSLVLKMDKELYTRYKHQDNFYTSVRFSENLSGDNKYELVEPIPTTDNFLPYFAPDGFVKEFETEAEAWEYIFNNNIRVI